MVTKLAALFALLALSGCGGEATPPPKTGPATGPVVSEVEAYMPLVTDTVLAYDTKNENTGEKGVLMMRIRRARADLAELTVGGRVQRLELVADGIRQSEGGWLLKAPLSEGAHFKGSFGDVEVTAVGKPVSVPAGNFNDCVVTVEQDQGKQKKVTTTFCRDVGIARLDVEGNVGDDYQRESAVLRSHGPAVDIGADLPPPPPKH